MCSCSPAMTLDCGVCVQKNSREAFRLLLGQLLCIQWSPLEVFRLWNQWPSCPVCSRTLGMPSGYGVSEWLRSKPQVTAHVGKDVEKEKHSSTAGAIAIWLQPLWKSIWRFLGKLEMDLPDDPAILLLGIDPKDAPPCHRRHVSLFS